MQSSETIAAQTVTTDLVLIGGGHSHAIVLRDFGMRPVAGVRLTLITDVYHTPYSGMLPAYVAGLYGFDDCHIDLRPLSRFAQAAMVVDRAIGLDLQQQRVLLANHPPIAFDWLSIDIGSTPATFTVPGAAEHAIPVKPISKFLQDWDQLVAAVKQAPTQPLRIAVVGGGAGGVELTLAVQARLQQLYAEAHQPNLLEIHLFHRTAQLVPERSTWVGQQLQKILIDRGVQIHLSEQVVAIESDGAAKKVRCKSSLAIECDRIFWVTQAAAAGWLAQSGLATDDRGFIRVQETLQSASHPQVFAAGDVASMVGHPRPKAGVFAVRQGKPLAQNLRRVMAGQPPRPFVPQKEFLILIGTADRSALATRGPFGLGPYPWLWRWKDWIDRQFMQQFSQLGSMISPMPGGKAAGRNQESRGDNSIELAAHSSGMHCAGCGSKVGSGVLRQALFRIQQEQLEVGKDGIVIGLEAAEDAAVIRVPAQQVLVQTVDYFRALVQDPFLFGQICTNHCLSDLFAMAAKPQSALAIVTLPYATPAKLEETLYQLLSGAVKQLTAAEAALIGGHTIEGPELAFGLSCNGLADPDRLWRKSGLAVGQALILTKPLGTGTLFAADMQGQAKGRWIETAIESMLRSNQAAMQCLQRHQATACTDVTGFGLLGHLWEMLQASQVGAKLTWDALPILPGAAETLQQGIFSSLYPQNLQIAQWVAQSDRPQNHPLFPILFDPQTAGGLLASVPVDQASDCVAALQSCGYPETAVIGYIVPCGDRSTPISIC